MFLPADKSMVAFYSVVENELEVRGGMDVYSQIHSVLGRFLESISCHDEESKYIFF